jgi:DNA repair photolyase
MIINEIFVKEILSKSKVFDYTVNPYVGCEHGCSYCYARFMKRFTKHKEEWGNFVDVKKNAVSLLQKEVKSKKRGKVWISGVCDPYQPLEKKYEITRKCLEALLEYDWPIVIQTKSPLVFRDAQILKEFSDIEIGISITTADDNIRNFFEPNLPSIKERIEVLERLHNLGIKTFSMIAPILPETEGLVEKLRGNVDYVLIDKMNYHYSDWIYKKNKLEYALTKSFFDKKKKELAEELKYEGVPHHFLF